MMKKKKMKMIEFYKKLQRLNQLKIKNAQNNIEMIKNGNVPNM